MKRGPPSFKAQYDYAWCLVRSPAKADMQHGIVMLEGEKSNHNWSCVLCLDKFHDIGV